MKKVVLVSLICCLVVSGVFAMDKLNVFLSQTGSLASGDPLQTETGQKLIVDIPEKFMNLTRVTNIKKGETIIVTFLSKTTLKVEIPSHQLVGTLHLKDGKWKLLKPFAKPAGISGVK